MDNEPLTQPAAKKLIESIAEEGSIRWKQHALDEMTKEDILATDVVNILLGGSCEPPELENGQWRYRIHTAKITVVISFRSETALTVITAWRNNK